MQYWYSAQLRQYRLQFIRAFSNFYVKYGNGDLVRVPCRYGDPTRIAASVVRGNSENKILSTPMITCLVTGINMSPSRRQDPQLVQSVQVNERKYDNELGRYTNEIGNRYTVERYMPVPYDLTMQVDIWTENLDIKEQLLEQILVLYNPAIDVQTSVNPIDWTVLSIIEMQDSITWSSRSIPVGTENPIDVATFLFKLPIWINPPAKVKRQSIIHQIVTNIVEGYKQENAIEWDEYQLLARNVTTPGDATIQVDPLSDGSYAIRLCDSGGSTDDRQGLPTITNSTVNPTPVAGTTFVWNGKTCRISDVTSLDRMVADIRSSLSGTTLNCVLFNDTTIQFVNGSGTDNVFSNVTPGAMQSLGLAETTYPGGKLAWWRLLQQYGSTRPYSVFGTNASQIRLKTSDDLEQTNTDIVGWFDVDPIDQNLLIWYPDEQSLPSTTITGIDAVVDPQQSGPGINLPTPTIGQRYLLVNDMPLDSISWGATAPGKTDDIMEFDGNQWQISWDASTKMGSMEYVLNNRSNRLYRWHEDHWVTVIKKTYKQGYWRLSI